MPPTSWVCVDHAGNEHAERRDRLGPGRNRVDDVARHDALLHDVLHVDGRRRAGDRDRFLSAPTRSSALTVAVKRRRQLDALALDRVEAGQRKRDAVVARHAGRRSLYCPSPSVTTVRDLFDQGGAGGFHGDAGQHGARRVPDDAGDAAAALGKCQCGQQEKHDEQSDPANEPSSHTTSLKAERLTVEVSSNDD